MGKLEKPLEADTGWQELHAPELIKWEKPGETFAGVLIAIDQITVNSKKVPQYRLALGERVLKFLGTFDITQKLTRAHIGCQVRIKYLGTDDAITGGPENKPMKVFSIQTRGTPSRVESPVITDDDIPF